MANPPPQKLEEQIAELEAVVSELRTCSKCGKSLEPDQATCPSCGTIVGEQLTLPEKPAPVVEIPKPQAEAPAAAPAPPAAQPIPPPAEEPSPPKEAAVPAAAAPSSTPAAEPARGESAKATPAESAGPWEAPPEPAHEESGAVEEDRVPPAPAAPARVYGSPARDRAPSSAGRYAVVGGGAILYVLGLFGFLPYFGKYAGVGVMVLATLVVVAGVLWHRPEAAVQSASRSSGGRASAREPAGPDFVCPLCGSDVARDAQRCAVCGAEFEA